MLFYKRSTLWTHLRGNGFAPMDATCRVSWGEGIKTPYLTAASSLRPLSIAYLHSLLLLFWFTSLCLWLVLVSIDVNHVVFIVDLHMKYTVGVVPLCTHIPNSHNLRSPSKGVKAKHSLWQQPCGRHGWIDTEYILYKDGIVTLIVGQSQQSTTQFVYFRCCFF